eukprot:TRINITY_DN32428_c0_g1_i1.p1 TRINITY_DN32428_c0_g1~~TRINITY_DN32428_c0_g1_i1.p1  ORF type:complete len:305 (+),score=29.62 TRINITY_DN32428_c0_g1_i1:132-1046(+)
MAEPAEPSDWIKEEASAQPSVLVTRFRGADNTLVARAVTVSLDVFQVLPVANPTIFEDSFPRWLESTDQTAVREAAADLRSHGQPLSEWVPQLGGAEQELLCCSNGIQSNYIAPFGFTVVDGVQQRQAYAVKELPMSTASALVLDPPVGVQQLRFKHPEVALCTDEQQPVALAVGGVPLLKGGTKVAGAIQSSNGGSAQPDTVLWVPEITVAAFTAIGLKSDGVECVLLSVFAGVSVFQVADLMELLGATDAVLCGGSADVQQWVAGEECELVEATSRQESTNPGARRRLNSVLAIFAQPLNAE